MDVGAFYFPADYGINIAELARALEDRGFGSLFVPEHTHIPTCRRSPFPGGGELPKRYSHTHDPFVALAFAAAATKKLKIGTGILLVPQHEPIVTAKAIASLDQLSGGRFVFGIGGGWNVEEMENHGVDYPTRWKLVREKVAAMRAIWTEDAPEYHGELVDFDPIWSWPKPAQKPHPPIYLGGHGRKALERVVRYCDGWMPIPARATDLKNDIAELRALAEQAGRDPDSLTVSLYGTAPDAKALEEYAQAGAHRALFGLPSAGADTVLPLLDRYAELVGKLG